MSEITQVQNSLVGPEPNKHKKERAARVMLGA